MIKRYSFSLKSIFLFLSIIKNSEGSHISTMSGKTYTEAPTPTVLEHNKTNYNNKKLSEEHENIHKKIDKCIRDSNKIKKESNKKHLMLYFEGHKDSMLELYTNGKITFNFLYTNFHDNCLCFSEKEMPLVSIIYAESAMCLLFKMEKPCISHKKIKKLDFLKGYDNVPLVHDSKKIEKDLYKKHKMNRKLFFSNSLNMLVKLAESCYNIKSFAKSEAYTEKYLELYNSLNTGVPSMTLLEMLNVLNFLKVKKLKKNKNLIYPEWSDAFRIANFYKSTAKKMGKKIHTKEAYKAILNLQNILQDKDLQRFRKFR